MHTSTQRRNPTESAAAGRCEIALLGHPGSSSMAVRSVPRWIARCALVRSLRLRGSTRVGRAAHERSCGVLRVCTRSTTGVTERITSVNFHEYQKSTMNPMITLQKFARSRCERIAASIGVLRVHAAYSRWYMQHTKGAQARTWTEGMNQPTRFEVTTF